jgi:hypothetical protein
MKWRGLDEASDTQPAATLKEELEARKLLTEKYVPAETSAVHRRAVEDLRSSGISGRTLPVGAVAPSFELPDQDGTPVASSDLL